MVDYQEEPRYDDQGGRRISNDRERDRDRDREYRDRDDSRPMQKKACYGDCIRTPRKPMIGVKDVCNPRFGTMLFAEVLGTFFLVFMGCGSVRLYGGQTALIAAPPKELEVTDGDNSSMNLTESMSMETVQFQAGEEHVMIAFAFGITVACIAQAIGHVSGAHLNPAVSFGLVLAGHCSLLQAICYTIAQIIGAILGSLMLWLLTFTREDHVKNLTANNTWNLAVSLPSVPALNAFVIEIFLTFLLVLVVCGVCDNMRLDVKGSAPLAIGLAVFVCHVTGMQYSGASINPARSIGPICFPTGRDRDVAITLIWIYIFGPLIGGLLAGITYHIFFREKDITIIRRSIAPAPVY